LPGAACGQSASMLRDSSLRVIGSLQFLSKNPRFGHVSVMLLQSSIWYLGIAKSVR
jgi:hypothetical protein